MKRPSFQFYTKDWRTNPKLRRCSPAARGVWMDVLCVLHDADEQYGLVHWPLAELASVAAAPMKLIQELVERNVLKGCDSGPCDPYVYVPRSGRVPGPPVILVPVQAGPVWYSSRMVRDEYKRMNAGKGGRFGERDEGTGRRHGESPTHAPSHRHGEDQGD